MKRHSVRLGIALLGTLCFLSCSDEISNDLTTLKGITVKSEAFQYDEPLTKASYTVDPNQGFILNWTDGDVIGIFPVGGDQVAFPISSGSGSSAQFDGGSWAVRSTYTYAAYYPFNTDYYTIAQTALPVSYTGQAQTSNGSTASLGSYDYQASAATAPDGTGNISITVKHLGCFVRLQLTVPVVDTFTSLTLTSDNGKFVTAGTFDLTSATPSITGTATSASMSMSLSGVSNTVGNKVVTLYMMMAPADLSTSTITATLAGTTNQSYTSTFQGKNMQKGKAYSYSATMNTGTNINGESSCWENYDEETPSFWVSDGNGHYSVDLGLSVRWATYNVGASIPEGIGDYIAWGETETYYSCLSPLTWKTNKSNGYCWDSYKYCNGDSETLKKYCSNASYGYNSYTDSKTVLEASDDAATVNWGNNWRMPTGEELDELLNSSNCSWTWTTLNGVHGYKVQSLKSGFTTSWIFLPATGWIDKTVLYNVDVSGQYWCSSQSSGYPYYASKLGFSSEGTSKSVKMRFSGYSIRPVLRD